jgi:hypothetical protein
MTKRATKKSRLASSENRTQLSDVAIGSRARLLDNSIVLVAATIGGRVFVRDDDGTGRGPYELPNETVVLEVMAPDTKYATDGDVIDPLAGGQ